MNELISLPAGLADQVRQAQELLNQSSQAQYNGDYQFAVQRAQEGIGLLQLVAQQQPELAALMFAAQLGYSGIQTDVWTEHTKNTFTTTDRTVRTLRFM